MVKVNRYNIKDLLLGKEIYVKERDGREFEFDDSLSEQEINYDSKNSILNNSGEQLNFDFFISSDEFSILVQFKPYECSKNGKRRAEKRLWCVFRTGVYQDFFMKEI